MFDIRSDKVMMDAFSWYVQNQPEIIRRARIMFEQGIEVSARTVQSEDDERTLFGFFQEWFLLDFKFQDNSSALEVYLGMHGDEIDFDDLMRMQEILQSADSGLFWARKNIDEGITLTKIIKGGVTFVDDEPGLASDIPSEGRMLIACRTCTLNYKPVIFQSPVCALILPDASDSISNVESILQNQSQDYLSLARMRYGVHQPGDEQVVLDAYMTAGVRAHLLESGKDVYEKFRAGHSFVKPAWEQVIDAMKQADKSQTFGTIFAQIVAGEGPVESNDADIQELVGILMPLWKILNAPHAESSDLRLD